LCLINLKDGRLVSCGSDKKIIIWRLDIRSEEITLEGHKDIVNCLIELKNGKIVSCSLDKTIKFWN
jgi:WD40 repeat protein